MICPFCEEPVDPDERSAHREIIGWEERRKGGGANQVPLREKTGRYAHHRCIDREIAKKRAGASTYQRDLF